MSISSLLRLPSFMVTRMRGRVPILAILAASLLSLAAVLLCNRDEGSKYKGRPLSHWVLLLGPEDSEARQVLKNLDPKDIPYLVCWIRYDPPAWRTRLWQRVHNLRPRSVFEPVATWIGQRQREDLARGALSTFELLGTNAASAIPPLLTLMKNDAAAPDNWERASRALAATGLNALPGLVEVARDSNNPARFLAGDAAFDIMCRNTVDAEFTNKLRDSWARAWFTDRFSQ